jgi:DNA-directed RNA polymerase specialized sigma24 family protein
MDPNSSDAAATPGYTMLPPHPESSNAPGSVTRLLPGLKAGEHDAVGEFWDRYFQPLVRVAADRMNPARCRAIGPEDLAQEVLLDLCRVLAAPDVDDRFPRLTSRENLWKLLVCFAARAAFDHNTKESRRARVLAGGSGLGEAGFTAFAERQPAPDFAVAVGELLEQLADRTNPEQAERLQTIAVLKMEGYEHTEIADRLGCSVKSVERKVELIRKIWEARALDGGLGCRD